MGSDQYFSVRKNLSGFGYVLDMNGIPMRANGDHQLRDALERNLVEDVDSVMVMIRETGFASGTIPRDNTRVRQIEPLFRARFGE
jgi:hypothetical protein